MARVEIDQAVLITSGGALTVGAGASVQVNIRGGGAATVYADSSSGSTLSNPLTADAAGRIEGWVDQANDYDLVVSGSGFSTYTQPFVIPRGATGAAGSPGVGANWRGVWSSGTTYATGDGVFRNGLAYISNTSSNLNHDPLTDAVNWGALFQQPFGVDVWNSQANPASVTDWGPIINTLIAAGTYPLNFGCHDFPFSTPIELNQGSFGLDRSLTLQGAGGAGWERTGNWSAARTRLIWKGGAGTGKTDTGYPSKYAIWGGSFEGVRIADMGIYYDHAAFDQSLILFKGAHGIIERCTIGSYNGSQRTGYCLVDMAGANMCTLRHSSLAGAQFGVRGLAVNFAVSDGIDILNNVFGDITTAFICNPGNVWTIQRNNPEGGSFGTFATPYFVHGDLGASPGGLGHSTFRFLDNRCWDGTSNTQLAIHEPAGANYSFEAAGNLFATGGIKLEGGADSPSAVSIHNNDFGGGFVFGAGDPSPIDLGTNSRHVNIGPNRYSIGAGGPSFIANRQYHSHLRVWAGETDGSGAEQGVTTLSGQLRAFTPAVPTGAAAAGATNIGSPVTVVGNDISGEVYFGTTAGGASNTGALVEITLNSAGVSPPGASVVNRALILLTEQRVSGTDNTDTIVWNPYAEWISTTKFRIGCKTAIPASKAVRVAYWIVWV